MDITGVNAADPHRLRELLLPCADIPSWVDGIVAGRPYDDADALLARADALAERWTDADVERALAQHPRIGERHAGPVAEAAMSAREQSGVAADDDVAARLRAGNLAYEERFGRVYLVRAAGRSAEEVLAMLEQRLGNDDATEAAVTAGQLREIARLRLQGVLAA